MIQFCFPTVYWHFDVGKLDLKFFEDKCEYIDNGWNCKVKTSRNFNGDWTFFIDKINAYIQTLPLKKPYTLKYSDPWMNIYEKGCYQEPHHHVSNNCQLSYCYFHKLPESSGKFGFYNEQFRNYCSNEFYDKLNLKDDLVEWGFPEVSEGHLLVFPSFLIHQVTYHPIEDLRITVSGNVSII